MSGTLDKIKQKINPKTERIRNEQVRKIGEELQQIQNKAKHLEKMAQDMKKAIKKYINITEDEAKHKFSKELMSFLLREADNIKDILLASSSICEALNLKKEANVFKDCKISSAGFVFS